jgi:hypothetical protein
LGHARREQQPMLAALLRPLFNADTGEQAHELVGDALERLGKPLPKVAALLEEAEEDLLTFYAFSSDHWPKLRSTNRPRRGDADALGGRRARGLPRLRLRRRPSRALVLTERAVSAPGRSSLLSRDLLARCSGGPRWDSERAIRGAGVPPPRGDDARARRPGARDRGRPSLAYMAGVTR